jgi:acyl-CoA synthetase (AMP-forming)/AMP-acid ligase II
MAPRLRLLVSGGARLERATEEELEALGWTVLSGYGLAETASLFTGNRPNDRRLGSAGRPLAGGEVRIADADDRGIGEIELRGSSITKAISTISKPIAKPLPRMDGSAQVTWVLSIGMGFCWSPVGQKRSWCWPAAKR